MGRRHLVQWAAIAGTALAMASASVSAQKVERKAARPIASVQGVDTFNAYCAVCHGTGAKGNGPAAKALTKTPADLTTIARRHGGTFSDSDVENTILGTQDLISHGTREMPIWGPVLKSVSAGDDAVVKLRVANLVRYLRSIQTQ
jgi:mono/diheme cytochrome c family protein